MSIAGSGGYKKNDSGYPPSGSKQNGSLDSRYTPDPNQKQLKPNKPGVDIIRPRTNPRKSFLINCFFLRISDRIYWFNELSI